jgi:hypothetical protein
MKKNKKRLLSLIRKMQQGGLLQNNPDPVEEGKKRLRTYGNLPTEPDWLDKAGYALDDAFELFAPNVVKNTRRPRDIDRAIFIRNEQLNKLGKELRARETRDKLDNLQDPLNYSATRSSSNVDIPIQMLAPAAKPPKNYLQKGGEIGNHLQNIAPLIGMIPGGQAASIGLSGLGSVLGMIDTNNTGTKATPLTKQFEIGGEFKQYNAPSHANGGQYIDTNGNPTNQNKAVAEIEKNENSHDGFVYSDHLVNSDTGNTFAKDAKDIEKMTKGKDDISKQSKILQLLKLKEKNKIAAQVTEVKQAAIPKAQNGLPITNPLFQGLGAVGNMTQGISNTAQGVSNTIQGINNTTQGISSTLGATAGSRERLLTNNESGTPIEEIKNRNLNPLAAGLKGASLLASGVDALQNSEKERLQLPDFSRGDAYMQGLELNLDPVLSEIDMQSTKGIQDVSNQAGGIGARNSRVASILARAGRNKANAVMQQQQGNAQIKQALAGRVDRNEQVESQERTRQQIAQSQNDATARLATRKFFSDLSQVGSSLNQIQYLNDAMKNQNEIAQQALNYGLVMLSQKYPNFKPSDDFVQRLQSGQLTTEDGELVTKILEFVNTTN